LRNKCNIDNIDYILIAEKPKAARAIALSLIGRPQRCAYRGIPYWMGRVNGTKIIIAPAAGHLFTLATLNRDIPVFEYEWKPRWIVERGSRHTKKYLQLFYHLKRSSARLINACDYDVEGSVIGYMIIKYVFGSDNYYRMKFSSLTTTELKKSYHRLLPPDRNMVESGLCRHELDWIWGINVSRMLMIAYKKAINQRKILSAGRVQTPTLIEAINKYMQDITEIPIPKFQLYAIFDLNGKKITTTHVNGPFEKRSIPEKIMKKLEKGDKGEIVKVKIQKQIIPPPTPFNLNDLQEESYRLYGYSPYKTQKIAEELYLDGLISYPRTNSQKYPKDLNHFEIMKKLASIGFFKEVEYIKRTNFNMIPREGRKTDPAHPAIYPTGKSPGRLTQEKQRIFNLIVKRYLAGFMKPAIIHVSDFLIEIKYEKFRGELRVLKEKGWTEHYPASIKETIDYFVIQEGSSVILEKREIKRRMEKQLKRHSKTSLLRWMENNNIGTESTRAPIIETLFTRKYLSDTKKGIKPTLLGLIVSQVIENYFPKLSQVGLTRLFEEKIEKVREGQLKREEVVEEARKTVQELVNNAMEKLNDIIEFIKTQENAKEKCYICDLPANNGLCKIHEKALEKIIDTLPKLREVEEKNTYDVLKMLSKSKQVGEAIREVAKAIIEEKISI